MSNLFLQMVNSPVQDTGKHLASRHCAVVVEPSCLRRPEAMTSVANAQQHVKELMEAAEQADLQ